MSEVLRVSSNNINGWLEKKASPTLIPIREEARKLLDEMESELEGVTEASRTLLESSKKEVDKKSKKTFGRARALHKLARIFIKRMGQIKVPEEVSYVGFHKFTKQTQKAFVSTEVDIKNWFPRISPYFILDRRRFQTVFEKAESSLKDLQTFLEDEYIKTKTLEETFQLVDGLLTQEEQLANLKARKEKTQAEKTSLERRITETEEEMEELKNRASLSQIGEINKEMKELRKDVKRGMRHLRKPLMKFQRLVFREGGLAPAESKKLEHYIKKPFRAFATEEEGYPNLKNILRTMKDAIDNGKLNLKHSRRRKAEEDMDRILNNDYLAVLHQKCQEMLTTKEELATSTETERAKGRLRRLDEKLKKTERAKERVELEENSIERNSKEMWKKIEELKKEIEKNILDLLGTKVLVDSKVQ